jgi:hypothetical protein
MKNQLFSLSKLPCNCEVRGHYTCKKIPIILVNRMMDKKRTIRKNGGRRRRRRDTRGNWPKKLTPKGKVDPWGENYIDMCPSIILKS